MNNIDNIVNELKLRRQNIAQYEWRIKFINVIKELNERNLQRERAKNVIKPTPKGWIAWFFGY